MKKLTLLILIAFLFSGGCGRISESSLNEILERDPSFKKALDAKNSIDAEILSLKNDFNKEKDAAIQKMRAFKEDLKMTEKTLGEQISSLRQEMGPKIDTLRAKLEEVRSTYKMKTEDLKSSISKLASIRKLLGKKSELSLSGDEISIWNKRAGNLEKEINSLRQGIDKLRTKIRVLKTELKILQN